METTKSEIKDTTSAENKKERTKRIQKVIPEDTLVKVKSGFYGKLYYKNLVTKERIVWERQGEIQILTLRELRAMRTAQPAFFKNQWVIILGVADGEDCEATPYEICKSLAILEYYKDFIDPSDFELVCKWSDEEIVDKIRIMAPGTKENLIVALNQFIADGRLDSIKKIKLFEKTLDCNLRMS